MNKPIITLLSDMQHSIDLLKKAFDRNFDAQLTQKVDVWLDNIEKAKKGEIKANRSKGQYKALYESKAKECLRLKSLINNDGRRYDELQAKFKALEIENIILKANSLEWRQIQKAVDLLVSHSEGDFVSIDHARQAAQGLKDIFTKNEL